MASEQKTDEVRIEQARGEGDFLSALAIREVVFIEEQRVPAGLEHDEEDARAFHVLAYQKGHAVGTGRLVALSGPPEEFAGRWGRIGRMAVLASSRGSGIGTRILSALEEEARRRNYDGLLLHAQVHARDFYSRAGYQEFGPVFDEAGMPHVTMRKLLRPSAAEIPAS